MMDIDPVTLLSRWYARELRIAAEGAMRERKPWHRRNDARIDAAAADQLSQAGLDEDAVPRMDRVGIKRREGEKSNHRRTSRSNTSQ